MRDRVLLLVGFAGAVRSSELVGLNVDDLTERPEGMTATVRRSKTDQHGAVHEIALPFGTDRHTCPVTAVTRWLEHADIANGPLFRTVNRHGHVGGTRLTSQSVTHVVRRTATRANMDRSRLSSHSLRAGFATSARSSRATRVPHRETDRPSQHGRSPPVRETWINLYRQRRHRPRSLDHEALQ